MKLFSFAALICLVAFGNVFGREVDYIYITRFWLSGLVSGGVYMHPESTKKDVAKAILQGLQCGVHGKALPVASQQQL